MALDPTIVSALAGLFGGMFGPDTGYLQDILRFQMKQARGINRQAKWFENYGQGVAGSDPQEQAQMNTMLGVLGSSGRQGYEGLIAQGYNSQNAQNVGDMLSNYGMAQSAQRAAAMGGLQQNWLGARHNARVTGAGLRAQAAGIAGGAAGTAGMMPQGQDIGGLLAGLASQYAYGQQNKQYNQQFDQLIKALMGMAGQQGAMPTAPLRGGFGGGGAQGMSYYGTGP